jgi:hypothetical protein
MAQKSKHFWLINRQNDLHTTAEELIAIVKSGVGLTDPPLQATELLATVKSLLSYE